MFGIPVLEAVSDVADVCRVVSCSSDIHSVLFSPAFLPSLMLYTGSSGQRLAGGNLIKPVPAASDRFSLHCG